MGALIRARSGVAAAAALALAGAAAVAVALVAAPAPEVTVASSHREAPAITEDPTADNTDLYAFRSRDRPGYATIIANWNPGEDPAAGPNYYRFSDRAVYKINIDSDGDAQADTVYRFTFRSRIGPFFLGNTAQNFTVERINGGRVTYRRNGITTQNNIGPRSTKTYPNSRKMRIFGMPGGGKLFAGQREDPFFADIGAIFDLLAIRKGLGNEGGGKDFFAGYGVHTIALQLPISSFGAKNGVIGIWSSTERPDGRGGFVQVSRLGNPLVNEVVVPTAFKDAWNASQPKDDAQFAGPVLQPILAKVINKLYPKVNAPEKNRTDLVAVFGTGVPKLNYTGPVVADMLRLNLRIKPTPLSRTKRLGVIAGDLAGFPNGRRLEDDVIDIAEQVMAGFLKGNKVPLGDGVNTNDRKFLTRFPYIQKTFSGYRNTKGQQRGAEG